ncbi:hypothetical protein GH714_024714 [Hevea brasiliensis]|uniref:Uncharacterized protein n=1 Tax=Hevea brasiliensis TaxID=3981 RepID=A0A6A6NIY5_HEVBR|nr:hypothetical protein GH714_024714 [Hevea brasiliensis]
MLPRSIRFQQTVEATALYFSEEAAAEKAVGSGVPKTRMRNAGHVSAEINNSLLQTYAKAGKMPPPVAKHMKIMLRSKSSPRPQGRRKYPINWASGGYGMQAIFLDSGQNSCGTGVFLPRRAGTNLQSSKKPACSPVLLPARVIQALNLNTHEIGLQISRRQDAKNMSKGGDCISIKKKNGKDASTQCCVVSPNENSSPETFLPKEWTY